jgi:hypothetical protein
MQICFQENLVIEVGTMCNQIKVESLASLLRDPSRPVLSKASRPILAWLAGRCCKCLARGHRAASCRGSIRCFRCLENGHRIHECHNPWRPLSLLATPASSSPHLAAKQCHAPTRSRSEIEASLPSKTLRHVSWASVP